MVRGLLWLMVPALAGAVEYAPTSAGFLVEKACYDKVSADRFDAILKETLSQGRACLKGLEGPTAEDHLRRLDALLANRTTPPRIQCGETDYKWKSVLAHATIPGDKHHPYLSLNPELLDEKILRAPSVIFHELFHNLGYRHYEDIEFPYTCEACCFPESDLTKEGKRLACRLCAGAYRSVDDTDYLTDLSDFFVASGQSERSIFSVRHHLTRHPKERYPRFLLAGYAVELDPAYAYALAQELRLRYPDLSEWEASLLDWIESNSFVEPLQTMQKARKDARKYLDALDSSESKTSPH